MKNKNRKHTIKDPPTHNLCARVKWWKTHRSERNNVEKPRTARDESDKIPARDAAASSYYNMSAWYDLLDSPPLYHGA
jgi:hypothetical protein